MTAIVKGSAQVQENGNSSVTVHDFTGHSAREVYDKTQTDATIKDGDVLNFGGGNVGIMIGPWPTVAVGEILDFHALSPGQNFDTFMNGKYAASLKNAREIAVQVQTTSRMIPVTKCESDLIRDALTSHRELLASATSADRDVHGDDWADKQIQLCDAVLGKLQGPSVTITTHVAQENPHFSADDVKAVAEVRSALIRKGT